MADEKKPDKPDLGDFFAKRKKKTIKGTNMNIEKDTSKEDNNKKSKDKGDDGWMEEQISATGMGVVEVAGKLIKEEETKDQEESSAPVWGGNKAKKKNKFEEAKPLNEKKFPTLAKAAGKSSNINVDDGSAAKINIATSKNLYAALQDGDSDDDSPQRPTHIKPAMVSKVKGEMGKVAIQREVDKYATKKDDKKGSKKKAKKNEDSEEEEEEDEEEEEEVKEVKETKAKKRSRPAKSQEEPTPGAEEEEEEEVMEDLKMVPDIKASRQKYVGREKMPTVPLSAKELAEEKENRPAAQQMSKKKKKFMEEEIDDKPKLMYADWD